MAVIKKQVNSSNLASLEYDTKTEIMIVEFLGGSTYQYENVPKTVFDAIVDEKFTNQKGEPSVGATFIKLVKNYPEKYPYTKLS